MRSVAHPGFSRWTYSARLNDAKKPLENRTSPHGEKINRKKPCTRCCRPRTLVRKLRQVGTIYLRDLLTGSANVVYLTRRQHAQETQKPCNKSQRMLVHHERKKSGVNVCLREHDKLDPNISIIAARKTSVDGV